MCSTVRPRSTITPLRFQGQNWKGPGCWCFIPWWFISGWSRGARCVCVKWTLLSSQVRAVDVQQFKRLWTRCRFRCSGVQLFGSSSSRMAPGFSSRIRINSVFWSQLAQGFGGSLCPVQWVERKDPGCVLCCQLCQWLVFQTQRVWVLNLSGYHYLWVVYISRFGKKTINRSWIFPLIFS